MQIMATKGNSPNAHDNQTNWRMNGEYLSRMFCYGRESRLGQHMLLGVLAFIHSFKDLFSFCLLWNMVEWKIIIYWPSSFHNENTLSAVKAHMISFFSVLLPCPSLLLLLLFLLFLSLPHIFLIHPLLTLRWILWRKLLSWEINFEEGTTFIFAIVWDFLSSPPDERKPFNRCQLCDFGLFLDACVLRPYFHIVETFNPIRCCLQHQLRNALNALWHNANLNQLARKNKASLGRGSKENYFREAIN